MTLQSFKKNFLASQREHVMNVVSDKTCWVFVTHNVADLQSPASLKDAIEVHWQQEKGARRDVSTFRATCGFGFRNPVPNAKKMLPGWWHIRHGSHEQAIKYCTKDATRVSGPYKFERALRTLHSKQARAECDQALFEERLKTNFMLMTRGYHPTTQVHMPAMGAAPASRSIPYSQFIG